jgi:hypothetical protein
MVTHEVNGHTNGHTRVMKDERRTRYTCEFSGMLSVGAPGDSIHCAGCGQTVVLVLRQHDRETVLPFHNYPTKAQRSASRAALSTHRIVRRD